MLSFDPETRQLLVDDETGRPIAPSDDDAELILLVLATQLGSAARDREFGTDWASLRNIGTGIETQAEHVIRRALRRYSGRFTVPRVTVRVLARGHLGWEIEFRRVGAASGAASTVTGTAIA